MPGLKNDPAWVKAAYKDLGLKEIVGKKHNPRVVEMFAKSGHPYVTDDETAWCMAAVNTWLAEGGQKGTGALNARSALTLGTKLDLSKRLPRGAVLVFPRGNSSWQGHVGFCVGDDGKTLKVLGGNQGNSVSIVNYAKSKLLGARWPAAVVTSDSPKAIKPPPDDDLEAIAPPPPDIEPVEPGPQPKAMTWWEKLLSASGLGSLFAGFATIDTWQVAVVFGAIFLIAGGVVWFTFVLPKLRERRRK